MHRKGRERVTICSFLRDARCPAKVTRAEYNVVAKKLRAQLHGSTPSDSKKWNSQFSVKSNNFKFN